MIYFPYAKINIGLNVIRKREDGLHDIKSVFYPLPIKDVLEIRPAADGEETTFVQTGIPLMMEYQEDNLVMKAYRLLAENYPQIPALNIHLHKIIPPQAGLGGGSSDAAFTLLLINRVCELDIPSEQLHEYAKQLGSDVAFFLQNEPKYVLGAGDILRDTRMDLSGYWLTLLKIPDGISTKEAYEHITPCMARIRYEKMMPVYRWKSSLRNDFEPYVFEKYPVLAAFKDYFYKMGAKFVSLTGTGSCIYAVSTNKLDLKDITDNALFLWQGML
ncbi:MAG: 4-(cytidine 5'-diphospho)-2-C-methyl-D-erythritol kinase [Bacteroidales bacterium]|jgi:4-diphosphocytidyl-2-C-methyl-D-erythritol kinase|nr:4-(cytidine 5'-diphospho)-2-C-methyl-D-erythritol kinase [Bacteroidales bacterium]